MSDLTYIQGALRDTSAQIAQLERRAAQFPRSFALELEIKSLEKRRRNLEAELLAVASGMGLEVCSYRIIPEQQRLTLSGLAGMLGDFQSVVSVFYDAVRGGPKTNTKLSAEAVQRSALEFAYTFAGSVGFVFTVPNETTLYNDSHLDEAIRLLFEASRAENPDAILGYARRLGPAPIRTLYRWADGHVKSMLSADITWRHGDVVRQQVLIQRPEFERLTRAISETSEEIQQETVLTGTLVGADVVAGTFHFEPDTGHDIRGHWGGIVGASGTVELRKRYRVRIRKTTKVLYSTDEEKVAYELLSLEPI